MRVEKEAETPPCPIREEKHAIGGGKGVGIQSNEVRDWYGLVCV